jgi:uncharacterized Zn finger protein (UPF0148 family)
MNHKDIEAIRRDLALVGQIFMLGKTAVSCVLSLVHKDGRTITSHCETEEACLIDIHRQTKETML